MKRYIFAAMLSVSFISYGCSSSNFQMEKQTQAITLQKKLNVKQTQSIALEETSGIGWRINSATKTKQIIVVGDRKFEILVSNWSPDLSKLKFERFDVGKLLLPFVQKTDGQSSWEAVASDGSGCVFVLQEEPGSIFVFNSKLNKHLHTIKLVMEPQHNLSELWKKDPNKRGEGLVLLKNGHVLVIKQKNPSVIIEFGQAGEAPQGYSVGDAVGDDSFPLPSSKVSKFVPLKYWKIEEPKAQLMKDLSEVTVGSDSKLYLLSDVSQRIGRINDGLAPNKEEFYLSQVWNLSDELTNVEGLLLTEDGSPIVTLDKKQASATNLFMLDSVGK